MTPTLLDVLVAEIAAADGDRLDRLADQFAPLMDRIDARRPRATAEAPPAPQWLTTRQAAAHLGITVPALHKLTAARSIPFEQDRPGCKCWFRTDDLDAWRRGQANASSIVRRSDASKMLPSGHYGSVPTRSWAKKNPV